MADRIRITNESKHNIGLKNQGGIEYNLRPGTFITLAKDEAEYMIAIGKKMFDTGELRIDNEEMAKDLDILAPGDPSPASDDVIKKALNGSAKQLEKYLDTVKEPYVIEAIYQMSKTMDLPTSKMNLIKEAFPNKFIND